MSDAETPKIKSIKEYVRARITYQAWRETITKDNIASPASVEMYALGGEIERFEEEYEREQGCWPLTVEVEGKTYLGKFERKGPLVTVHYRGSQKSTQPGANIEVTASMLLRELVREIG
jgi:hypothetical protein